MLHWNPAREFYATIGAAAMDELIPYRLEGEPLRALGTRPGDARPAGADLAAT